MNTTTTATDISVAADTRKGNASILPVIAELRKVWDASCSALGGFEELMPYAREMNMDWVYEIENLLLCNMGEIDDLFSKLEEELRMFKP